MNETVHYANGSLIKIVGLFWSKKLDVKFSRVMILYQLKTPIKDKVSFVFLYEL